jgi:pimeloyl-ACP methyl ester carboxylesterase
MRKRLLVVASVLIFGAGVLVFVAMRPSVRARALMKQSRVALHRCDTSVYGRDALCGTYEVYEHRVARSGRKIPLNIVVRPASGRNPFPDPVFWLDGGPGAAATEMAKAGDKGFLEVLRGERDIVYVDQRGTGKSNGLFCNLGGDPSNLTAYFGDLFPLDKVRTCREKLQRVANLKLYTTPIAMDDLDEIRSALGYEKINLVAGSYGTIAAMVYVRQHEENVRAVYLAGVGSPMRQPLLFVAKAAQNALHLTIDDCAHDSECRAAFPSLDKEFAAVIARFNSGPVHVELPNISGKGTQTVSMTRGAFVERLRPLLSTTETQRWLPLIIHRAYLNDYRPFAIVAIGGRGRIATAFGMSMTVTCSEGVLFITEKDIENETRGTFVGEYRIRAHIAACSDWPRGDIPATYNEPVRSSIPVLMISGEVDGSVPPDLGESMLKTLEHGRQIRIRYYGHQITGGCVVELMRRFIHDGSADGVDASCVDQIRRPTWAFEMPK